MRLSHAAMYVRTVVENPEKGGLYRSGMAV